MLRTWCEAHSTVPPLDDVKSSFVLDFCTTNAADEPMTCVVISTHKMLQNRMHRDWHVDATYKLAFKKWPLILIVLQSPDHRGRIIACCVVSGETNEHFQFCLEAVLRGWAGQPERIVSDADDAIGLAIEATLPNVVHVMCWFHMGSKAAWPSSRASDVFRALRPAEKVTVWIFCINIF